MNIDDIVVGRKNDKTLEEIEEEYRQAELLEQEELKQPIEKKIKHDKWKVRKSAYTDILSSLKEITSRKDPKYLSYSEYFHTMLLDPHTPNMETVLDIISLLFANSDDAITILPNFCFLITEKLYTIQKLKTKAKNLLIQCIECCTDLKEVEANLKKLLDNKNSKNQIASIQIATIILRTFGSQKLDYRSLIPFMEKLADNTNPSVKNEVLDFYKELYKWIRDSVKGFVSKLKEVQRIDLEKVFEEISKNCPKVPIPEKTLKSDKEKLDKQGDKLGFNKVNNSEESNKIDMLKEEETNFNLVEGTDVFAKFTEDWTENILDKSRTWVEKRDILEEFIKKCDVFKIKNTSKHHIISCLIKLLKDSNVNIQSLSLNAIGVMAKGLRKDFSTDLKELLPAVMDKLKEKKGKVLTSCFNTMESILKYTITLEDLLDNMKSVLPGSEIKETKENACILLEKTMLKTNISLLKKICKPIADMLVKTSDDKSGDVRDACIKSLGVLKARVGELLISKYLGELNEIKRKKLEELSLNVIVDPIYNKEEIKTKPTATNHFKNNLNNTNNNPNNNTISTFNDNKMDIESDDFMVTKPNKVLIVVDVISNANNTDKPNIPTLSNNTLNNLKPKKVNSTANVTKTTVAISHDDGDAEEDGNLTNEELEEYFRDKLGNEIITNINDTKWDNRKNAFIEIGNWVRNNSDVANKCIDLTLRFIKLKLKDYKENNFNIIKEAINVFIAMIENCDAFGKRHSALLIKKLHEKFGDNKLKAAIASLFITIMQYHGPKYTTNIIIKYMNNVKGPTVLKEFGLFLENVIEEFGINLIPTKEIVEFSKILANNPNPQLRNVATAILCLIYKNIGPTIKKFLNDIKEATLKVIESEFEKITVSPQDNSNNTLKRELIGIALNEVPKQVDGGKHTKTTSNNVLDNIFPRVDISKKLNSQKICKDIHDGKWPLKKETLEQLEKLLNDNNMRILPNGLNEIVIALKNKLNDGNKNLIKLIIQFITKLVEALGSNAKMFIKTLIPDILANLSDKQSLLRDDVIKCLDKWVEFVGIESLFPFFPTCLKLENFELRTDLLKFLIKHKSGFNKYHDMSNKDLVHAITSCHLDKALSIRLMTEEITKEMLKYINIQNFYAVSKEYKPAISSCLKSIFDKIAGESMGIGMILEIPGHLTNRNGDVKDIKNEREVEKVKGVSMDDTYLHNKIHQKLGVDKNFKNQQVKEPTPEAIISNKMHLEGHAFNNTINTNKANNINTFSKVVQSDITPNKPIITSKGNSNHKTLQSPSPSLHFLVHKNIKPYQKQKRLNDEQSLSFPIDFFSESYAKNLKFTISSYVNSHFVNENAYTNDFTKLNNFFIQLQNSLLNEPLLFTEIQDIILKWVMIKNNENTGVFLSTMTLDFIDNLLNYQIDNECCTFHLLEEKLIFEIIIGKLLTTNTSTRTKAKSSLIIFGKTINFNHFLELMVSRTRIILDLDVQKILIDILLTYANVYVNTQSHGHLTDHAANHLSKENINELVLLLNINNDELKSKVVEIIKLIQTKHPEINSVLVNAPKLILSYLKKNLIIPDVVESEEINDALSLSQQKLNNLIKNKLQNFPKENNIIGISGSNFNRGVSNNQVDMSNDKKQPSLLQSYRNFSRSPINFNFASGSAGKDFNMSFQIFDENKLGNIIQTLKNGETKDKFNSLAEFLDIINQTNKDEYQHLIIKEINNILMTLSFLLKEFFDLYKHKNLNLVNYTLVVFYKLAQNKEIIQAASNETILYCFDDILKGLVYDNLESLGDKESKILVRSLNGLMLKIMENCKVNTAYYALIELSKNYRNQFILINNNNQKYERLCSLAIKCLIKLTQIIDTLIKEINIEALLDNVYDFIKDIESTNPSLEIRSQTDEICLRILKTIVNEIIKIKKQDIWNYYNRAIEAKGKPDKHLKRWIQLFCRSISGISMSNVNVPHANNMSSMNSINNIMDIVIDDETNCQANNNPNHNNISEEIENFIKIINNNNNINKENLIIELLAILKRNKVDIDYLKNKISEEDFRRSFNLYKNLTSKDNEGILSNHHQQYINKV